jgi:hypothetical protein
LNLLEESMITDRQFVTKLPNGGKIVTRFTARDSRGQPAVTVRLRLGKYDRAASIGIELEESSEDAGCVCAISECVSALLHSYFLEGYNAQSD